MARQNAKSAARNSSLEPATGDERAATPLEGRLLERRRRRRVDLKSLTGTARESAKRYLQWDRGQITGAEYFLAIRGLACHRDNLLAVEHEKQSAHVQEIAARLQRLEQQGTIGASSAPVLSYDLSGLSPAQLAELQSMPKA
jgi:hypothetical protein